MRAIFVHEISFNLILWRILLRFYLFYFLFFSKPMTIRKLVMKLECCALISKLLRTRTHIRKKTSTCACVWKINLNARTLACTFIVFHIRRLKLCTWAYVRNILRTNQEESACECAHIRTCVQFFLHARTNFRAFTFLFAR